MTRVQPRAAAPVFLLCWTLTVGCTSTPHAPEIDASASVAAPAKPWTSLTPDDARQDFDFLVVTDRTGEHRAGVFASAMPKVNLLRPAFVMSVGDLIEGYTDDRARLEGEWDEFDGFIEQLNMPFFYVPGNHDLSNETMAEVWRERFGASYYHFLYKDVLFIALNSELFSMVSKPGTSLPGPDAQQDQMAWLQTVLQDHPDVRWTLVFVHQPFWDSPRVHPDWTKVEGWLADRPHTVFAGHLHEYTHHTRQGRDYITLATTGGGSPMRGLLYGEFDHVALVSMRKDGPVIANLLLDGIHGPRMRDIELRGLVRGLEKSVRAEPSRFGELVFTSGELRFQIHNDADTPLQLSGSLTPSVNLAPSRPSIELLVEPNSVSTVRVPLTAAEPTPFEALAAAKATWHLSTRSADGSPVTIELESALIPERVFDCPAPEQEIVLDGSIADWDELALAAAPPALIEHEENVRNDRDASFRFDVRCDDATLYLAVAVEDDSIVASPSKIAREQDGVNLMIDARPDPKRSAGGQGFFAALADGTMSQLAIIGAGPEPSPAPDPVFSVFLPPVAHGIETASQRTTTGYTVEFALPIAVLEDMTDHPFEAFRVDLSVYDFDDGEPGHATLWWRPSRFSPHATPGSGTFARP